MKKKWIKQALCVGLSLAVVAAMTGCVGDSGNSEVPAETTAAATTAEGDDTAEVVDDTADSGEKITLRFWDMVWGDAEYAAEAEKLAQRYTEENPNVEIEYQSIPWQNRYETFSVAIASGEGPDVSTGGGYQQHQFAASGDILPLNDIIDEWEAEGKLDDFPEGMVEFFQDSEGNQLGIPFNIDPRGILYRTDLFEEAGIEIPTTWDELYEAAVQLTDADDNQYGLVYPVSDSTANIVFASWMLANGGGVWNEDGITPTWTSEENKETIEFITKLRDAGVFPDGMASYENPDAQKVFLQGNAAMIVNSVGLGTQIVDQGEEFAGKVALMPMPKGPSAAEPAMASAMNAYMAYSTTEHPEEAKAFLKWWSENNLELWTGLAKCGSPPARLSFLNDPSYTGMEQNPLIVQMYEKWIPEIKSTMYPGKSANLVQNTIDAEKWWTDMSQAVLVGEKTADQMLEEKQNMAEEAIEDFGL